MSEVGDSVRDAEANGKLISGLPAPRGRQLNQVWRIVFLAILLLAGLNASGADATLWGSLFGVAHVDVRLLETGGEPPWRRIDSRHQYFRVTGRLLASQGVVTSQRPGSEGQRIVYVPIVSGDTSSEKEPRVFLETSGPEYAHAIDSGRYEGMLVQSTLPEAARGKLTAHGIRVPVHSWVLKDRRYPTWQAVLWPLLVTALFGIALLVLGYRPSRSVQRVLIFILLGVAFWTVIWFLWKTTRPDPCRTMTQTLCSADRSHSTDQPEIDLHRRVRDRRPAARLIGPSGEIPTRASLA